MFKMFLKVFLLLFFLFYFSFKCIYSLKCDVVSPFRKRFHVDTIHRINSNGRFYRDFGVCFCVCVLCSVFSSCCLYHFESIASCVNVNYSEICSFDQVNEFFMVLLFLLCYHNHVSLFGSFFSLFFLLIRLMIRLLSTFEFLINFIFLFVSMGKT